MQGVHGGDRRAAGAVVSDQSSTASEIVQTDVTLATIFTSVEPRHRSPFDFPYKIVLQERRNKPVKVGRRDISGPVIL